MDVVKYHRERIIFGVKDNLHRQDVSSPEISTLTHGIGCLLGIDSASAVLLLFYGNAICQFGPEFEWGNEISEAFVVHRSLASGR